MITAASLYIASGKINGVKSLMRRVMQRAPYEFREFLNEMNAMFHEVETTYSAIGDQLSIYEKEIARLKTKCGES